MRRSTLMPETARRCRVWRGLVPALLLTACSGPAAPEPLPTQPPQQPEQTTPAGPTTVASTRVAAPTPSQRTCEDMAAALPVADQVGQLFMLAVDTGGLDAGTRKALERDRIGSVVLLGNTEAGSAAVAELTGELATLEVGSSGMLVAVDQEGGQVQRLRGNGFTRIPPATKQGELAPDVLQTQAAQWGSELRAAGVRYNLAPVADVVPPELRYDNPPIGALDRHYGDTAAKAGPQVAAFVRGMREAGVATSLKHFPGLGKASANTDFDAATDDAVVPGDPDWAVFTDGIEAGADSVMVSSATYERIDPDHRAVFSSVVMTDQLRTGLGFDGVIISDDLGAAASVADVPAGERAVRFLTAGGDLVINADASVSDDMVQAVLEQAAADPDFAAQLTASAGRVLRLKASVGLTTCS